MFLRADAILRGSPGAMDPARPGRTLASLAGVVVVFGLFYGAVMGTFSGFGREHVMQLVYSAVKVPILLQLTFVVSLPSFFVINSLLGVRADFGQALRALVATQAGLTIILASLAPLTAFWYFSCPDYNAAVLFNTLIFGLASVAAQLLLRRYYRELIARNPVHRILLILWLVIFAFVGIQMGWMLRPFIGNPDEATTFVRHNALTNAYLHLWEIISRQMR